MIWLRKSCLGLMVLALLSGCDVDSNGEHLVGIEQNELNTEKLEAEHAYVVCGSVGIESGCSDKLRQGLEVGEIIKFPNLDFDGVTAITIDYASMNPGSQFELRLDCPTGPLVGTISTTGSLDWQHCVSESLSIAPISGVHHLYVVGKSGPHWIAGIDFITLEKDTTPQTDYADYTSVFSGGFSSGNNSVHLQIGDQVFFSDIANSRATAGIYAVAVYDDEVLLSNFYNTFLTAGAARGLFNDIDALPNGAFVVLAAKDEPACAFDSYGQQALAAIGAVSQLDDPINPADCWDKANFRASYYAMGIKGGAPGSAQEELRTDTWVNDEGPYAGQPLNLTLPPDPELPVLSSQPGEHTAYFKGMKFRYYIPANFDSNNSQYQYLVGVHGAGDWHWPGAKNRIYQFTTMTGVADAEKLVIIAPAFDPIFNWEPQNSDYNWSTGKFNDPTIVKDYYLWDFIGLINPVSTERTDVALLELMDHFYQQLMPRDKFYLHGHSGGGQYVNRFATLYPEKIIQAASSSPGTVLFPDNSPYPYGTKMNYLANDYGLHIDASGIEDANFNALWPVLCDSRYHLLLGSEETVTLDGEEIPMGEMGQRYLDAMRDIVPGCQINVEVLSDCAGGGCDHSEMVNQGVYRAVELFF